VSDEVERLRRRARVQLERQIYETEHGSPMPVFTGEGRFYVHATSALACPNPSARHREPALPPCDMCDSPADRRARVAGGWDMDGCDLSLCQGCHQPPQPKPDGPLRTWWLWPLYILAGRWGRRSFA
jgi:hypothetical protein